MKTVTMAQWRKMPADYKSKIQGIRHILVNENGATVLVPVKVI